MKNSLMIRIFTLSITAVMVSLVVVSLLLYGFLGSYSISREQDKLKDAAKKMSELTEYFIDNQIPQNERALIMNIEYYSRNLGAYVVIFDDTCKIAISSSSFLQVYSNAKIPKQLCTDILNQKEVMQVGEFGDIFKGTVIAIGKPILSGGKVIGGIYVIEPTPQLDNLRRDVLSMFLIAVLAALVVTAVLSYLLSVKLTRPILEIRSAACTIAGGQFERRVNITQKDEIGQLAAAFNDMAESLENIENMRRSFIENVSHELRTPMTIIAGFIEGINDGTVPYERQAEYLKIVQDEVRRLSRLVSDLLDMARLEEGARELKLIPMDINELIRLIIIRFEQRIDQKNIEVNIEFESDSCMVTADKDAIERVLTNLIDNAVKFVDDRGYIRLRVETRDTKAYISVENSGVGINVDDLRYVWDRFYKTDKSRSMDKNGAGLGLYIVKSLLNLHDQDITVESDPEHYTRFTFTLNIADI